MKLMCIALSFVFFNICACSTTRLNDQTKNSFSAEASQGVFNDRIRITWTTHDFYQEYIVFRSKVRDGKYIAVSSVITGGSFDDFQVSKGQLYYYKIKGYNSFGISVFLTPYITGYSGELVCLKPPVYISVQNASSVSKISFRWESVQNAFCYEIWKSEDNKFFVSVAKTPYLYYEDYDVEQEKLYYYQISSIGRDGSSSSRRSQTISSSLFGGDIEIFSPVGLYEDKIELSWKSLPYVSMYYIFRSENLDYLGICITSVKQFEPTLYSDFDIVPNRIYYYTIVFRNNWAIQQSRRIESYLKSDAISY